MTDVMIISQLNDWHGYAVSEALGIKKASNTLYISSDYPTKSCNTIKILNDSIFYDLATHAECIHNRVYDVVWYRRPSVGLPHGILHPADYEFGYHSCETLQKSMFKIIGDNAFWINPIGVIRNKIIQQNIAIKAGFKLPDTLYSNDPKAIREFIVDHGGRVAFKPLVPHLWINETTNKMWGSYVKCITIDDLVDEKVLACSPGIMQEYIDKIYDVRVTVFGKHIISVKILSQESSASKIDWRAGAEGLRYEIFDIDDATRDSIYKFMRDIDLVFGAFDFVVRDNGDILFLEVNDAGQFLFVENETGEPVLDAFCDFLISRDPEFIYKPKSSDIVSVGMVEQLVRDRMLRERHQHVNSLPQCFSKE